MVDRHDVQPHHLLRAALADGFCRHLISHLAGDPDALLITLDQLWLDAADAIDVEEIQARGIDMVTVLAAINPPFDGEPDWRGRRLTDATRDLLVRALGVRAIGHGRTTGSGHVLLALMGSRDPLVAGTFRAHGLHARDAKPLVERWSRRSP